MPAAAAEEPGLEEAELQAADAPADAEARDAVLQAVEQAVGDRDEGYLRLAADFENFRRRTRLEFAERSRYASEDSARELLPVLDNLRRAVEHASGDTAGDQLRSGLDLVVREFEAALGRLGVVPIEAVGTSFDPAVHEAVGGDESDEVETDTVIAELQRGYRLHDRVLRPALVRVAHPKLG